MEVSGCLIISRESWDFNGKVVKIAITSQFVSITVAILRKKVRSKKGVSVEMMITVTRLSEVWYGIRIIKISFWDKNFK